MIVKILRLGGNQVTMKSSAATLLAAASVAYAQLANVSEPSLTEIEKAAATIEPYSPVSNVEGLVFNRFYQIWLENIVWA